MASAAATVKKVFLELGGKSANLILDDADFSTALLSGLAVCYHAGQGCAITTRILLPKSRYAEGVETLKAMFGYIQLGDQHAPQQRSEEHTSELQSLMRNSYAVFCLKKKRTRH